jgi:hypothetical protein
VKRALALAALVAVLALADCGSSGPFNVTVSGTVVTMGAGSCNPGQLPAGIQPGTTQVTVTSPSGTVLGTTYLGQPSGTGQQVLGQLLCKLPFRVTSVPTSRMYGIKIAGVSGASWAHKPTGIIITVTEGL